MKKCHPLLGRRVVSARYSFFSVAKAVRLGSGTGCGHSVRLDPNGPPVGNGVGCSANERVVSGGPVGLFGNARIPVTGSRIIPAGSGVISPSSGGVRGIPASVSGGGADIL